MVVVVTMVVLGGAVAASTTPPPVADPEQPLNSVPTATAPLAASAAMKGRG
jgi:hypothetical protein